MVFGCCCTECDNGSQTIVVEEDKAVGLPLTAFQDDHATTGRRSDSEEPVENEGRTFQVTVVKTASLGKLGLDTRASANDTLLKIEKVKHDGLIFEWNAANPDCIIQAGDRIIEVNGVTGLKNRLYDVIARDTELTLTVQRISE
mmetsp:Transcript_99343/g.289935  ORF Transcript_99343/g.289935 Transcript_99343/m.289935 type:complete len:144 (-) Transcript_99343:303-734(-)